MKLKTLLLMFILVSSWGLQNPLIAAQEGMLTLKKGTLKLVQGSQSRIVRQIGQRIPLNIGDWVQTGANSKAEIVIQGKAQTIELSSQSFFKMEAVSPESSHVVMLTGKARFNVPPSKKKLQRKKSRRFRLRTVTALIGVRGTEFVVGATAQQTSLLTLSGVVSMASVELPEIEVNVPKNQASGVKKGATPTAPVKVPPAMREQIIKSDSPEVFKSVELGATAQPKKEKKSPNSKKESSAPKKEDATLNTEALDNTVDTLENVQKIVEEVDQIQQDVEQVQKEIGADSQLQLDISFE